jgi:glycosyltransferase involved in cell wall biosynthesis
VSKNGVRFTVLIPAYNEEALITKSLLETCREMDTNAAGNYEVIVVDDGSQDNTYSKALRVSEELPQVSAVRCLVNLGKGKALQQGFEHARGEFVFFLDADLDIHPNQLWKLYRAMQESGADVVVGSKHHPRSRLELPLFRRIVSAGYMLIVHGLFDLPLHDTQTGIKLFRREVLERVYPRTRVERFAFDLEMLVAATRFGYRVAETPVKVAFRREGQGRIGIWTIIRMWQDTLSIFYRASFWKWLSPSWPIKVWLVVLAFGLVLVGVGLGQLLMGLSIPLPLQQLFRIAALQFIDRTLRNWIFFVAGVVIVTSALIQLNKYVLAAFARADQGDLAGIMQRHARHSSLPTEEKATDEHE